MIPLYIVFKTSNLCFCPNCSSVKEKGGGFASAWFFFFFKKKVELVGLGFIYQVDIAYLLLVACPHSCCFCYLRGSH